MAFFDFKNVRIAGVSAGVPQHVERNDGDNIQSKDYDAAAYVELTGVLERHFSKHLTTSDLSCAAAERLIADLNWDKEEIGALIFVSQTADYRLPATSCILQNRLGLNKECFVIDISLGCSGWVYGMCTALGMMSSGQIQKALVLAGDAKGTIKIPGTKPDPLFGHAGTATALEYKEGEEGFKFHMGVDGGGFDAIIQPDGGARNPTTIESFEMREEDGKKTCNLFTHMKGMDVFAFGITAAPKSIKKLAKQFEFDYLDADYFVFHQANMKMNNQIVKKLKLDSEKVPSCMLHFGNTSSASIPLTIVTQLKGKFENKPTKFICCGFGVGLSWGTVAFTTDNNFVVSDLVEVE